MNLDDYKHIEPKPGPQMGGDPNELVENTPEPTTQASAALPALPDPAHATILTSTKKVEANRRNAAKSTGPKTAAGKRRVARNAIKHGFFSKYILVQHPEAEESQAEYDELRSAIYSHFQPLGVLEEFWVERIVVSSWRWRRVLRAESGHIARALYHERQLAKAESEHSDEAGAPDLEPDRATDHLFVPTNGDLNNILRYDVTINKQLNHAIAQLERLQAMRKAEPVPGLTREESSR
jgi:hypothetical protein